MKEQYTDKELEPLVQKLGFLNLHRFKAFLGNFNDLSDLNSDELNNEEFTEKNEQFFIEKLLEIKKKLKIDENFSQRSLEEKILLIINITKHLSVEYLLKKFDGKLDAETAEKLVIYGYTHGSCNSLVCTLCLLIEECKPMMFKADTYGHQVVYLNEKFYDINGCSSKEEMMDFVLREVDSTSKECEINQSEVWLNKHKVFDYVVTKYIGEITTLNADNIATC